MFDMVVDDIEVRDLLVHGLHLCLFRSIVARDDEYLDIVLEGMLVQVFVLIDRQNRFEHDEHDSLAVDTIIHSIVLRHQFE
jgi:hypothetical protein